MSRYDYYLERGCRTGGSVQKTFAAAVEEDRTAGAADPEIVAGAFPACRVVVAASLGLHVIVVAIRLGHYAADGRRRRWRLLLSRTVTRLPAHATIQTAEASGEHVAHCA